MAKLTEEEEKNKHLAKLKAKYEAQIAELEEQLAKERQVTFISGTVFFLKDLFLFADAARIGKDETQTGD